MFITNAKTANRAGTKEISPKATELAAIYAEQSVETQYLLTAYLTLLCDIKQVRVDNDPQASLSRQIMYVAENRLGGDYQKVQDILASFGDYFDVASFEKVQAAPTPKADFIAFLNTNPKIQLAAALAKGKALGLSDNDTLQCITLWTTGKAVSA